MAANDSFYTVFLRLMLLLGPVVRLYVSAASAVPQKQRGRLGAPAETRKVVSKWVNL